MTTTDRAAWLNSLSPELRSYAERVLAADWRGGDALQATLDDVTAMLMPQAEAEDFLARLWREMS